MTLFNVLLLSILPFLESAEENLTVAIFDLEIKEKHIQLSIQLNRADFDRVVRMSSEKGVTPGSIYSYFAEHTTFHIDGTAVILDGMHIESDPEYYHIKAKLPLKTRPQRLSIKNTCLIHAISRHFNLVTIRHQDHNKGFRMHKGRTFIEMILP